jgi:hypothetical protein
VEILEKRIIEVRTHDAELSAILQKLLGGEKEKPIRRRKPVAKDGQDEASLH